MQFVSHSTQETEQFGEEVAKSLRGGDVLAFTGSLGMGKTAFTRGLARGLGCRGRVTSPTFTIVNEYDGKTPLFHFVISNRAGNSNQFFSYIVTHVIMIFNRKNSKKKKGFSHEIRLF